MNCIFMSEAVLRNFIMHVIPSVKRVGFCARIPGGKTAF